MAIIPVKFKLNHSNARLPQAGSSGFLIYPVSEKLDVGIYGSTAVYDTGLILSLPKGSIGLIAPLENINKTTLTMTQSPLILRGEQNDSLKIEFKNFSGYGIRFSLTEPIAQLIVLPDINIEMEAYEEKASGSDRILQGQNQGIRVGDAKASEATEAGNKVQQS